VALDCVVDANIAVKWVLQEPDSAKAIQVGVDVQSAGGLLHFLDMARIEAVNVIWLQVHRRLTTVQRARVALDELRRAPVQLMAAEPLLNDAFDLALQFDIAVYDACFVAAVQKLGCRGVTADVPLVRKVGSAFPSIILLKD
jgi:predicted nucleic acid-binding protein